MGREMSLLSPVVPAISTNLFRWRMCRHCESEDAVEFRMLGPVELWTANRRVELGPMKQRTVLAALLVDVGRPVPPDIVIERVWADLPPAQVRNVLRTYVARLRTALARAQGGTAAEPRWLRHEASGYVIDVDPKQVDLHRFRILMARADAAPDANGVKRNALREALALWRGEPLAGLHGDWAGRMRESWQFERLDAVLRWADLELRLSNAASTLALLSELAARYPLIESLNAALIRALLAAGRGAEALARYSGTRRLLIEELGLEPGPELRQLHLAVLRGEPAPRATARPAALGVR